MGVENSNSEGEAEKQRNTGLCVPSKAPGASGVGAAERARLTPERRLWSPQAGA